MTTTIEFNIGIHEIVAGLVNNSYDCFDEDELTVLAKVTRAMAFQYARKTIMSKGIEWFPETGEHGNCDLDDTGLAAIEEFAKTLFPDLTEDLNHKVKL